MKPKGLIYCRVSSKNQVKEGNGLSSQESKCRRYATETLGIEVEKVFNEDGMSGGIFERKSIRALLDYIDQNSNKNYVVIFEDLNRLSRDIQVHNLLRTEFRNRGVELQCPNFQFDETPEGDFKENITVAMSQYERKKNLQRVIDKQTERLMSGFYCYPVPIGYKFVKNPNGGGKIVVKDSNWRIIKSTLEKYARNELETLKEAQNYLNRKGLKISHSSIATAFSNELYTGYYKCEKMGVSRTKGKHSPIISESTFIMIQEKLNLKAQKLKYSFQANRERKDISKDFPLRGFLYCEESNKLLSGGWSKGRRSKFPYYTYPNSSTMKGKSINRDIFHTEFETYLNSIIPKENIFEAFREAIKVLSNESEAIHNELQDSLNKELAQVERKISNYLTRIGVTESETLMEDYEKKLIECESEKKRIQINLAKELKNLGTPLIKESEIIQNALQIWKRSNLKNKKTLLKTIFPEGIPINEKKQVGTPTFSLIYRTLSVGERGKNQMVELDGFEPTCWKACLTIYYHSLFWGYFALSRK